MSTGHIRTSAARGILVAMVRRVGVRIAQRCWLAPELAADLQARCAIAIDTCADDTVIASTTAARIHGFWLPARPDEIHLASAQPERASRAMTRTKRREFRAHRFRLAPDDVVVVDGLPVMAPARTWVCLAADLTVPDLVAAGDSALRSGVTREQMVDAVTRCAGQRGIRRARAALPMLDERSRSRPESHLRVAVSTPDLPAFAVNEPVYRDEGGWLAEPDLSLSEARLALEYQGEDHAALARMRKDITRGTDLRRAGWLVIPYGPAEVFGRPWQIAPELRQVLRQRAPHLLRPPSPRRVAA
jgi:hypothetical protein